MDNNLLCSTALGPACNPFEDRKLQAAMDKVNASIGAIRRDVAANDAEARACIEAVVTGDTGKALKRLQALRLERLEIFRRELTIPGLKEGLRPLIAATAERQIAEIERGSEIEKESLMEHERGMAHSEAFQRKRMLEDPGLRRNRQDVSKLRILKTNAPLYTDGEKVKTEELRKALIIEAAKIAGRPEIGMAILQPPSAPAVTVRTWSAARPV